ncbi:hypothetical protein QJQ45_011425 [Haematococcus lacustris]|nr:hypothetical protein QJQ45_011425 [Haematococcus lacustris]
MCCDDCTVMKGKERKGADEPKIAQTRGFGTRGGWGPKAVLQACRKVVERANSGKPTDRVPGKVVTVDEFRTRRVSSAMNSPQPCEAGLDRSKPTRLEGWKLQPGQVQHRFLRSAWSKRFEAPVRGLMWCPQLHQATPGDLGKWVDRDCNAALNLQRAGESKWRPLELCRWQHRGAAPAKGKEYPALGFKKLRDPAPKAQAQQPLEEEMAELSIKRHNHAKQLVVFFGAATIGTGGGWGADAVLRACCKVVCRPRGAGQRRGRVVLVDEHRTSRVSSAVNGKQPCEEELDKLSATRPAGWKPLAGQVEPRLLRPAWSQERDQPVRGLMWCPVVAPRKPTQAPRSSQAATQPAASEPGPSTPPPAKRSKPAAEPTKGRGKGKGKATKAKPAPQPGRWLDRDCNAALNMQRIEESRWRPLELCYWPDQGALPAKGKEYPSLGYKRVRDKPPKAQEQQQQPAEAHVPSEPGKAGLASRSHSIARLAAWQLGASGSGRQNDEGQGQAMKELIRERRQVIKAAFRGLVEAARPDLSPAQVDAVVAEVNKRMTMGSKQCVLAAVLCLSVLLHSFLGHPTPGFPSAGPAPGPPPPPDPACPLYAHPRLATRSSPRIAAAPAQLASTMQLNIWDADQGCHGLLTNARALEHLMRGPHHRGIRLLPGKVAVFEQPSNAWLIAMLKDLDEVHLRGGNNSLNANATNIITSIKELYRHPGRLIKLLQKDMAEVSMQRHGRAKQLVVLLSTASIGTGGGWGADAVLRACCKVVCRPRGTDQLRGRVVLVDEHRTSRVSSAVNGQQRERQLNKRRATRPAD